METKEKTTVTQPVETENEVKKESSEAMESDVFVNESVEEESVEEEPVAHTAKVGKKKKSIPEPKKFNSYYI